MIDLLFGRSQEHQCYNIYLRNLDESYDCKFLVYQQDIYHILKVSEGHISNFEHEDLMFLLIGADWRNYILEEFIIYIFIYRVLPQPTYQ